MGALQKTLFIIALICLLTQTVRHLYVRWGEPTNSVLAKYEPPVKSEIKKAGSLDELVRRYDEARKKAPGPEPGNANTMLASGQDSELVLLQTAINEWESRMKEIFELRFFWFSGLVLLLLGLLCYRKNYRWLGLSTMTAGIAEMIWWTSPSFNWGGASREFEKLLTNKIVFSVVSILLLLGTAYIVGRRNTLPDKI